MPDENAFSADDLALLPSGDGAEPVTDEGGNPPPAAEPAPKAEPKASEPTTERKPATIAGGRDTDDDPTPEPEGKAPYWPDDWREKMAKDHAGNDEKAYKRELKRLQRFSNPAGIYGTARELESKFDKGGLVRIPGEGASDADIEAFNRAMGVPESHEEYYKDMKLANDAVVGEADKPFVDSFAETMHKTGATPAQFQTAMDWYYAQQAAQADQMDEEDDAYRVEAERALKDDFGASFKRRMNAMPSLFAQAPGGADISNEGGVYARLMGGRTADGKLIGNDPDVLRWLDAMRNEINPVASVVENGDQSGKTIDEEIKSIEADMRKDRRAYFKDEPKQARYRELLNARDKIRAKA